jgi:hypothetical protein
VARLGFLATDRAAIKSRAPVVRPLKNWHH